MTRETSLAASELMEAFEQRGLGPFVGVPCSFLAPLIDYLADHRPAEYLTANNEGEAIAIAAGFYLGGRTPVVMLQNSGLGNAVNPLTSLTHVFRIPMLIVVTWRGEPGSKDEPQHELMGRITTRLLDLMDIPHARFPECPAELDSYLDHAVEQLELRRTPFALLARKDAVAPYALRSRPPERIRRNRAEVRAEPESGRRPSRRDAIRAIVSAAEDDALFVATTGKTSRELFDDHDRDPNLYVVGSMGCASSVGLGVALSRPERRLVVLDGDGAALMRLEAIASIGHYAPANLTHVILDNHAYESTGGQETQSPTVDFLGVAAACGYRTVSSCNSTRTLGDAVARAEQTSGPHLIHVLVRSGSDSNLKRPSLQPPAVAERFRAAAGAASVVAGGYR
jgi:phosphonopyruvate decarboxylase